MKNSKLLKIIKTFSKEEMKEFEKLIASPFFSTGRNLMPLFKVLKKYHPDFDDKLVSEAKIFEKLYPGKEFNETTLGKLTTDLLNLSIEYIKQISIRKNPLYVNSSACYSFIDRNLDPIALKLLDEIDIDIGKDKIGFNYYFSKPIINDAKDHYYSHNRSMSYYKEMIEHRGATVDFMVKNFFLNLSLSYPEIIMNRNRYCLESKDLKILSLVDSLDLEKFLHSLNAETNNKSDLVLLLNVYCLLSTKHPDETEYFEKFKNLFFKVVDLFEEDFKMHMLLIFRALTMLKCRFNSNIKFTRIKFEIINFILKNNFFIDKLLNYFPKNDFKDFFLTGFELGEYEWAENFVFKYSSYLNDEEKEYTINLCQSFLHFAKKEFSKCIESLNFIDIHHPTEKLAQYYLKAAAFYELKYFEETGSLLDTYAKFIERDELASQNKAISLNFIACMKNLLHHEFRGDDAYLFNLETFINKAENKVYLKNWFLEKLEIRNK